MILETDWEPPPGCFQGSKYKGSTCPVALGDPRAQLCPPSPGWLDPSLTTRHQPSPRISQLQRLHTWGRLLSQGAERSQNGANWMRESRGENPGTHTKKSSQMRESQRKKKITSPAQRACNKAASAAIKQTDSSRVRTQVAAPEFPVLLLPMRRPRGLTSATLEAPSPLPVPISSVRPLSLHLPPSQGEARQPSGVPRAKPKAAVLSSQPSAAPPPHGRAGGGASPLTQR